MKSLQYCLHWLQFATNNLQQQINILRSFIVSLRPQSCITDKTSENEKITPMSPFQQAEQLQTIKSEIVETVRKAVDVISKYAGLALPEQARRVVRQNILALPARWTTTVQQRDQSGRRLSNATHEAAERVLTFAVEGVDVLAGVARVFSESIERADAWLERLRLLGINHQQDRFLAHGRPSTIDQSGPVSESSQAKRRRLDAYH